MAEPSDEQWVNEKLLRRMEERLARVVGAASKLEMPDELMLALMAWDNFCDHYEEPEKRRREMHEDHYNQLDELCNQINERMQKLADLFVK